MNNAKDIISETKDGDYLMAEYAAITQQIIHWDTFHWTKARFFLALEGIALFATMNELATNTFEGFSIIDCCILILLVVTNWLLCYVWLITGRRNRVFLVTRFERGLEIECDPALKGKVRLYHYAKKQIEGNSSGKGSHSWEINIPIIFMVAWFCLLIMGSIVLAENKWIITVAILIITMLLTFVAVRLHDWLVQNRMPSEMDKSV